MPGALALANVLDTVTNWKYKGEGNANIVLTYVGPNRRYAGTVLRVRKGKDHKPWAGSTKLLQFSLEYEQAFQEKIVTPLLGGQYISQMQLIAVTPDFLTKLSIAIKPFRPSSRQHKDLDVTSPFAALLSDHTFVPGLSSKSEIKLPLSVTHRPGVVAVEIKPKWGFLPTSPAIGATNVVKYQTCRYCMHQHWKAQKHPGHVPNNFCPLDLYAKDKNRIRRALDSLVHNPQNNLKLFIDGVPTNPKSDNAHGLLDRFFGTSSEGSSSSSPPGVDHLMEHLTTIIFTTQFLQYLKHHQRSLDKDDIEGIFPLYGSLPSEAKMRDPTITEWENTLEAYLARSEDNDTRSNESVDTYSDPLYQIYEYLLSATLKDCSMIITLWVENAGAESRPSSLAPEETVSHSESDGQGYILLPTPNPRILNYKVRVVDIDPKFVRKIPHYFELDQTIVSHFLNLGIEKRCLPEP